MEDRFAAAVAAIEARTADEEARRVMWRAHHWPDEYERCAVIGGRHVCRRCAVLYPVSLAVAVASLVGFGPWPASLDPWPIWLLCLPATVDFVGDQLGWLRYSARRQLVVTLLLAPALGRGFAHELDDRWSWEFWGPVLVFCTVWFVAALAGRARRDRIAEAAEPTPRVGTR